VLTQAPGYRKKKSAAASLLGFTLRRHPAVVKAMKERHLMYNRQMEEIEARERDGRAFVIRPPEPPGISRTEKDPEELERVYRMGRDETLRRLPELKAFLRASSGE
jgi:predicted patatin/cPLA2 family phospholipase